MSRKPVIAIDGFSSTGKSSISKEIAKVLGIIHMDTGALYRGVTYYGLTHCKKSNGEIDLDLLFDQLTEIEMEFKEIDDELILFLNGKDVSLEIRKPHVSDEVSLIAQQPKVREFLLETQRQIASKGGVIMDGRDIGTTVLPDADYKFFMTASIEERTSRRHNELKNFGENVTLEEVRENLALRDKMDSEREISPLRQAKDAIVIDNTLLTKEQTIELILSHIRQ